MASQTFTVRDFVEPVRCTGIVSPAPDFDSPVKPKPQARMGDRLVWEVEIQRLVTAYGQTRTSVETVRVPAAQQPVLAEGFAKFKDLELEVRSGRDGGPLRALWAASAVEQVRSAEAKS